MTAAPVCMLVCLLACALLLLAPQRAEAAEPDASTYFAEVRYYDSIQMKYVVQHGIDEYWTTTGDIPIGGFVDGSNNQLLDQAYCVDATVAFHGSDETTTSWPGGVTTDTTTVGYVVASPLAVSPAVRANLPSLYWLAVNGFRGERGGANNLADIRARYAALEGQYGTPIDETIAIMATKAAVWNFTDPTFALLSTSLTKDPANPTPAEAARYKLMVALMRNLVSDARAEGYAVATTTLDVSFDDSAAVFSQPGGAGTNRFYGPITVSAQSSNGTGTPERIYLTASGMYATEFVFVGGAPPITVPLHKDAMYGSTTEAPYVASGGSFYVMIPPTVPTDALVNIDQPNMSFAYLALHGLARSANVTYSGTPAIMAWQGPAAASPQGTQEWGHVQAFIGFINNIQASLYGEGSLLLRGNSDGGAIQVSKGVLGATDGSNAGSFAFTLEVFDNMLQDWVPVPLIPGSGGNISGDCGLSDASPGGLFSLSDGASAHITDLPFGRYRISEQASVDGYSAVYQVNSGSPQAGFGAEVVLGMQTPTGSVAFTNTVIPHDLTYTGSIAVSKAVRGTIEGTTRFAFVLERYNSERQAWEPVALDPGPGGNIAGGSGLSGPNPDGMFSLAADDTAEVTGLSPGRYRVSEQEDAEGYTVAYRLDAGSERQGPVAELTLTAESATRAVAFTNTADDGTVPKTPSTTIPATGDTGGRQMVLLAGILVTGLVIGGAGLLVHRRMSNTRGKVLNT